MKIFLKWLGIIIIVIVAIFAVTMIIITIIGMNAAKKAVEKTPQLQQQISQSVDNQRKQNVTSIANAVRQNLIDNKGKLDCSPTSSPNKEYKSLPTSKALIIGRNITDGFNLEPCIVPYYLSKMPTDPAGGTLAATGYLIQYAPATKTISVYAMNSYSGPIFISVTY